MLIEDSRVCPHLYYVSKLMLFIGNNSSAFRKAVA